ncbi:hypothetical protein BZM27_32870 [Paraburkholderia steynii]|uniref:Uncharacterized protein n=1 Tax=Paraburkholderia steynii TaxID=1245441 RepID=A0A4R0XEL0_9BURK|nr:hypothetical protein BZM27_32870 [Paraburkholderia steynii]
MTSPMHYQVNVCGGDFQHVRECFRTWKDQPLVYRRDEVRILPGHTFENSKKARNPLHQACKPLDRHALAAEVDDGERNLWTVLAAYEE